MNNKYIAIMAGGVGSRFWPSSTETRPKQFLDILNIGKSLLRMSYERSLHLVANENILIVTNLAYKDLVRDQIPELPETNILCEPSRNNTAPCIAYTALHIKAKDSNAVFAVLPSDHMILKETVFIESLNKAFKFANEKNAIVTLGISPTRPDTGYGYIEAEEFEEITSLVKVKAFKEKPNLEKAKEYLRDGNYLWNSGMFVWSIKTVLDAFKQYEPSILDVLTQDENKFGTHEEQAYIDSCYPKTKSISVDFALLERANNVYTIPSDIGWSDLGTWTSLYEYSDKDSNLNVIQGDKTIIQESKNCIIRSNKDKRIVINGLNKYIIVDEENALLIYPMDKEQEIKQIVKSFEES